ncbi:helix-turn-helix domain-containing protein [Shewanella algae]|uniref:helix-turn-helix domain-containing protein n=1 Tax=Shewanella algae TaxID=38313 RepID=UPI001F40B2DB|nr:helix-turn-helix transcriptional regulator [Shewanella algae]MCE9783631.1 helix-turn-helix domain-containing protein [Shewanella algae]
MTNQSTSADWHPADIKAVLAKRGLSVADIARANGLAPTTLRTALARRYPRGQELIAMHIGVPPQMIWPSRYQPKSNKKGTHQ